MVENSLLRELEVEIKKVEEIKEDYKEKNRISGESSYNDGAINAIENTENHIKRAIARAVLPEKVQELKKWIGNMCEAYQCNNQAALNAAAEQVVYEMFKETIHTACRKDA